MTISEKKMKEVLSREIQIPKKVDRRIQEAYQMLGAEHKGSTRKIRNRKRSYRAAAAALAACLMVPGVAYAASHSEFFEGMFGNSTRNSIEAETVERDNGKGGTIDVTLPAHEYVPVDQQQAEELLGENGMSEPVETQIGDHTLRVEDLVYDKNTAFLYFTLEREGGVTALNYSEESNRTKGATFSEDIDFYFNLETAGGTIGYENIFVDLEKSTADKLYCYTYLIWSGEDGITAGDSLQLHVYHYPCARKDLTKNEVSGEEVIPLTEGRMIDMKTIDMGENGYLEYSPVSLSVDMAKGMGLSREDAMDPWNLEHLEIKYKDGTSYVISDRDGNVESYGYFCGMDTWIKTAFDRLVDVDEIQEIVVNNVTFMVE